MKERIVLIVDDDSGVRLAIRRIVARNLANFTLVEAINGVKALQVVQDRKGEIDLIFCDVDMPVMTGDEFLREAFVDYPHLESKVLVTGNVSGRSFFRNRSLPHIRKPFHTMQMLRAIEEVLNEA